MQQTEGGEGRSATVTAPLSFLSLFYHGAPDLSSASFPFFQLKLPNCSPGLALMVDPEGCRDARDCHIPSAAQCCLRWGHLGSCARTVGNTQGGSGVPGGFSLHLAGPGCCGCCPCSQHACCRSPHRRDGSTGAPPAPSTKSPILGAPTLAPGKGPAMRSGFQSASPHPKPWKNKASAPTLVGVGKAPIGVYGGAGGGNIKPHLPLVQPQPIGCLQLPAHSPAVFEPPWGQGSSVGWGGQDGGVAAAAGSCSAAG